MHLFFSHPTSPVARGHALAIWDPGDPHWSPQTTIFTPETNPLSLAAFQESKDQLYSLETAKYTFSSLTGEVGLFGGSDGDPQGPRWLMHGPLPWVGWGERRKAAFGSFQRVLLVLPLLESG